MFEPWFVAPLSALISVIVGLYFHNYVNKQDSGTARMQEIAAAIKEGADAFLRREYTVLAMFVVVVAVVICIFLPKPLWEPHDMLINIQLALAYMFGSFCSALAGYLGLNVATKANAKVANAAQKGL